MLTVSGRSSRLRCVYCHSVFAPCEEYAACPGCAATYHPDCWRQELTQCASVGCRRAAPAGLTGRPGVAPSPVAGFGWTLLPWLLLPLGFFALAVATGGWVGEVMVSFGVMSLVLPVGWTAFVGALVALGLAGRR